MGRLGDLLEAPGALLGALGRLLEPSSGHAGRLQTHIVEMLKNDSTPTRNAHSCLQSEAKMRPSCAKLGPSWGQVGILRRLGAILETTWRQLEAIGSNMPSWSYLQAV